MNEKMDVSNNFKIKKLTNALFIDENICFALLFGSCVSGRFDEKSDIDIAVYFYKPPEGIEIIEFINNHSELVQKDIDLTILNRASPFLRHQIMLNCIRLFIKDRIIYRDFREKTITDFLIYKYISNIYIYDKEL
ncbi:MAG: DNA polymerase beta domain-containing protein [Candidatus Magnetoglobus multicellularis str. Araruama]|uniref:DNA polymerase beta domain-containing protein n=1 Tax=Candidatus Magnetoglobus multicellularis str. Araruama TaxID=890399 RepID=A0A1V1NZW0_9BACT|nr:MAG: DNA polymerase beta domain-containing protein [Candidatus Magnetoglobus multicellularis str. Araruama]